MPEKAPTLSHEETIPLADLEHYRAAVRELGVGAVSVTELKQDKSGDYTTVRVSNFDPHGVADNSKFYQAVDASRDASKAAEADRKVASTV